MLADIPNALVGQPNEPAQYRASGGDSVFSTLGLSRAGKGWDPWGPQSEHVKIFLDFREQAAKLKNEVRRLERIGGTEDRVMKMRAEEPLLALADSIEQIYEEQGALRKWRNAIYEDRGLSTEQQNVMLNYGGEGDGGQGPDMLMVLQAIEANRAIVEALTDWENVMEDQY